MAESTEQTDGAEREASPPKGRRGAAKPAAEQPATEPQASEEQVAAPSGPQTFAVDEIVSRFADHLGQPSFVVAGALHGVEGELTLDDAKGRIDSYLNQPATEEA